MTLDWQQIVALVCVAGAIVALVFRVRRSWKASAKGACGGCHSCETGGARLDRGTVTPIVPLHLDRPKPRDAGR